MRKPYQLAFGIGAQEILNFLPLSFGSQFLILLSASLLTSYYKATLNKSEGPSRRIRELPKILYIHILIEPQTDIHIRSRHTDKLLVISKYYNLKLDYESKLTKYVKN